MTAIVLQARLDSARLSGKSMLPLGGKPLIFRVMEALNRVPAHVRILACTEDSVNAFTPPAMDAGFTVFAGPKDDVLARYCLVLQKFGIHNLIRATGDNPFVFADAAAAIAAETYALGADYGGYCGLPYGAGVEAISAEALRRAGSEADAPFDREHVCPFLYTHPEQFRLHRPLAPLRWQDPAIRITVDVLQDYEQAQALYNELDRLENAGSLSADERYQGAAVIKAYRTLFPQAPL